MSGAPISRSVGVGRLSLVWESLRPIVEARPQARVLDIGGGTGGFAVRVAEAGHHVVVIDPSPDALAVLGRRAAEAGVADRVTGLQGDLASLPTLVEAGSIDLVLCHGVLEVVDDPQPALQAVATVLCKGGALSLLVYQRHAAVLARAMGGHFTSALEVLDGSSAHPHRFTAEQLEQMLNDAGLNDLDLQGVRVFSDLVPSALADAEPGASAALAKLEAAVSRRPEYLTLAAQIHALAYRR